MPRKLLSKGGNYVTRIVSNPFPHSRIVTKDESAIQEAVVEKNIHALQKEHLEVSSIYPYQHL
jgi:hypothetical protein